MSLSPDLKCETLGFRLSPVSTVIGRRSGGRTPVRGQGMDSDDVMPLQRVTFVIDTDLTVLEVISSELVMTVHADRALSAQKAPALIVSWN